MKTRNLLFIAALVVVASAVALLLIEPAANDQSLQAADRPQDDAGSRAAYERASSMRSRVQNKVINEDIQAQWLDGDTLIYRLQDSLTTWRYMLADANREKSEEAFDHARVATDMKEKLKLNADAESLQLSNFKLGSKGQLCVSLNAIIFEIDQRSSRLNKIDPLNNGDFDLPATSARRSVNGRTSSGIIFNNTSSETLSIHWVDASGQSKAYGQVEPGQSKSQQTFSGHLWKITNPSGQTLGFYQAEDFPGVAQLDGQAHGIEPEQERKDPRVSPDGQYLAFSRDNNLFVKNLDRNSEHQLTTDGAANWRISNEFYWSPDSASLVAMRVKPAQSRTVSIVESSPRDQLQPRLEQFNYLKPGDEIWQEWPELFDIDALKQTPIDRALLDNPWAISDLAWDEDSEGFNFLYNQRGHQVMRVLHIDTKGKSEALISEEPDTFVNYSNKTYFQRLNEGKQAIWMSERSGYNHLYLIDMQRGRVKNAITKGDWLVRDVLAVDEESETIRFSAMGVYRDQDPYHLHFGEVSFSGKGLTWLTEGDGTHWIERSPSDRYIVDHYSRVDLPPIHEIRDAKSGKLVLELARADWSPLLETGWKSPRRFSAKGRDGKTDIWGYVIEPSVIAKGEKLPVIESIYAGPHGHFVAKDFSAWRGQREISELGFYVVKIDGMGTNWRSKAFHDVCWKNLGDSGFADRMLWMQALAKEYPQMDLDRVGIYGGSAGGQSTLRALLAHGDFYKAGVADCGCHDNRMDKIWWNEAWMGWPIGDHYAEQSNVTQAHRLQGKLMLTVGEMDHNVDPASTMQVVDALIKADKDFDLIVFPGADHGAGESAYGRRRRADFFVRNLLEREPRWER